MEVEKLNRHLPLGRVFDAVDFFLHKAKSMDLLNVIYSFIPLCKQFLNQDSKNVVILERHYRLYLD